MLLPNYAILAAKPPIRRLLEQAASDFKANTQGLLDAYVDVSWDKPEHHLPLADTPRLKFAFIVECPALNCRFPLVTATGRADGFGDVCLSSGRGSDLTIGASKPEVETALTELFHTTHVRTLVGNLMDLANNEAQRGTHG